MRTLTINIPDSLELEDLEAKMLLASGLYAKGKLSLGQAAEMVGLTKQAFMKILSNYEISIFNYPASELKKDIKNAENYSI